MALQVKIPDSPADETGLTAALQDLGAEQVSRGEWCYRQRVVSPDEFFRMLKQQCPGISTEEISVTTYHPNRQVLGA